MQAEDFGRRMVAAGGNPQQTADFVRALRAHAALGAR
jgi:hypothetical protein